MDHEIFRTPNSVTPTVEQRATPETYLRAGPELDENMPMWRVQTEGYSEGAGQLIGIVSNNHGFLDSPDTELISGGVNTKGLEAVALGRHGNFFHWGFAASPSYLTEEAQLVLVNAIHYIARFGGQAPIARKKAGAMPRSYVEASMESVSDEGFARAQDQRAEWQRSVEADQAEVRARIEAGEEVSDFDRQLLDMPAPAPVDRWRSVRGFIAESDWERLGEDPEAIQRFLRQNLPYFTWRGGWYTLEVDEELKRFGFANDDFALLENAVAALDSEQGAPLARTLLERYTTESFASTAEWVSWLRQNEERLFFTEAGGYKWLVDTRATVEAGAVGDAATETEAELESAAAELEPSGRDPLDASLAVQSLGEGRYRATVFVHIHEDWHAYGHVEPGAPYTALQLELDLPEGVRREGDWTRPRAVLDRENPRQTLFHGELRFSCELIAEDARGAEDILCRLSYQVCDSGRCLPPQTKELEVALLL